MKTKQDMKVLVIYTHTGILHYFTEEAWQELKRGYSKAVRIDAFLPFTEDSLAAMHMAIPETNKKSLTKSILESMAAWETFEPNDYDGIHSWSKPKRRWSGRKGL